jgi:hypothetical protein
MSRPWAVKCFPSGTMIVTRGIPGQPHYYIYGPGGDRNRHQCCCDVRDCLNGGARPAWLNDLCRTTESYAEDIDGTSIMAVGPSIDRDPPNCDWVQDDSEEAQSARARLMDRLLGLASERTT